MTSLSDIENMWDNSETINHTKKSYIKCFIYFTRIIIIYFVCQYLFIYKILPKV